MSAPIIPTYRYRDARAAIEFLKRAFGFHERFLVPGEDDAIDHAQLTYGGGMIMLSSARDSDYDRLLKPPSAVGAVTHSVYIVVDDLDAHYEQALAAGAELVIPMWDEDHGRGYACRDPEGHVWSFGDYDPWK